MFATISLVVVAVFALVILRVLTQDDWDAQYFVLVVGAFCTLLLAADVWFYFAAQAANWNSATILWIEVISIVVVVCGALACNTSISESRNRRY